MEFYTHRRKLNLSDIKPSMICLSDICFALDYRYHSVWSFDSIYPIPLSVETLMMFHSYLLMGQKKPKEYKSDHETQLGILFFHYLTAYLGDQITITHLPEEIKLEVQENLYDAFEKRFQIPLEQILNTKVKALFHDNNFKELMFFFRTVYSHFYQKATFRSENMVKSMNPTTVDTVLAQLNIITEGDTVSQTLNLFMVDHMILYYKNVRKDLIVLGRELKDWPSSDVWSLVRLVSETNMKIPDIFAALSTTLVLAPKNISEVMASISEFRENEFEEFMELSTKEDLLNYLRLPANIL